MTDHIGNVKRALAAMGPEEVLFLVEEHARNLSQTHNSIKRAHEMHEISYFPQKMLEKKVVTGPN